MVIMARTPVRAISSLSRASAAKELWSSVEVWVGKPVICQFLSKCISALVCTASYHLTQGTLQYILQALRNAVIAVQYNRRDMQNKCHNDCYLCMSHMQKIAQVFDFMEILINRPRTLYRSHNECPA